MQSAGSHTERDREKERESERLFNNTSTFYE